MSVTDMATESTRPHALAHDAVLFWLYVSSPKPRAGFRSASLQEAAGGAAPAFTNPAGRQTRWARLRFVGGFALPFAVSDVLDAT